MDKRIRDAVALYASGRDPGAQTILHSEILRRCAGKTSDYARHFKALMEEAGSTATKAPTKVGTAEEMPLYDAMKILLAAAGKPRKKSSSEEGRPYRPDLKYCAAMDKVRKVSIARWGYYGNPGTRFLHAVASHDQPAAIAAYEEFIEKGSVRDDGYAA